MSLATPVRISNFQRKLYGKAGQMLRICLEKAEPAYRFYLLYDKIYRPDILEHAYALARENDGAPGVERTSRRRGRRGGWRLLARTSPRRRIGRCRCGG